MPRFKDQAIVIRCQEWSETSQIVTLLTERHGVVGGLAKGSRRASPGTVARYSGGFGLLTLGQAVGIIKATTDLATLTEWDLQQPYAHLRRNLRAMHIALYAAELTRAMLAEHDAHPRVFTGLSHLLSRLADPMGQETALLEFQWRFLEDCGYRPTLHLEGGLVQDPPLGDGETRYLFDAVAGGIVAGNDGDGKRRTRGWRVRRSTVAVLQAVASDKGGQEPLTTSTEPTTSWPGYMTVILERRFNTMAAVFGPSD